MGAGGNKQNPKTNTPLPFSISLIIFLRKQLPLLIKEEKHYSRKTHSEDSWRLTGTVVLEIIFLPVESVLEMTVALVFCFLRLVESKVSCGKLEAVL